LAIPEQLPVLLLNFSITPCQPGFESERFIVEDDCDLQIAMFE